MTLEEIKSAVKNNIPVYWCSMSYRITRNKNNKLFIRCNATGHLRGLTHMDGVTLAEPESDFFKIEED